MDKQQSLSKISKELMLKEPYYGFFLIMLNKLWDAKRVLTAGVSKNGINYQLAINPEFWNSLSDDHKLGLLKHELLHIAFNHLTTFNIFSNKKLANVAMDMEINQYINKDWLPEGGIDIDDYKDLQLDRKAGSKYYYDKLNQFKEEKEKNGTCGDIGMDKLLDDIESGNIPDHSTWEEFEDMSEAEKKLIEKQTQRVLSEAKEQVIKKQGRVPGEIESRIILEEILPPKFDWKNYIKRFTGISTKVFTKKTRRKENIRFKDNPGLKVKMKQNMLLAIDTSGSVNKNELNEFMNEMHHIYKCGVDITVIQADTYIRSVSAYKGELDLNIVGRGGTDFTPVIEYYNQHPQYTSLIYFTDGEASTSTMPNKKVLWVLSEESYMNKELPGKVIKLEL